MDLLYRTIRAWTPSLRQTERERQCWYFSSPGCVWGGMIGQASSSHGPLRMGLVLLTLEFRSSLSRYKGLESSARDAGVHFLSTSFCTPSDLGMETAR